MKIIQAGMAEISPVSFLFDAYRQFYQQDTNLDAARQFIHSRIENNESVIFLAVSDNGEGLGFVQLYPSFSSVSMKKMWYLNDLFVAKSARNQGVARALLRQVQVFAKQSNALTVKLATSISNEQAKSLYLSEGYEKITAFEHYTQRVK
ncbi:GNAT family N-acetyltransferase [Vibrio sp. CK2-1]|uniref:GNAT family N-acetyltransferase n=1 Tax=Vibrio sp. CK2-1 TaxID=2912249 RepID=UPI001F20B6BB|nr:GNAT family N-acetyltransferase [Vibrio sp. CK2-1]MCF7352930.1 GNAT family N-acetyltransferase [Vibrio sp. CK2-1]